MQRGSEKKPASLAISELQYIKAQMQNEKIETSNHDIPPCPCNPKMVENWRLPKEKASQK